MVQESLMSQDNSFHCRSQKTKRPIKFSGESSTIKEEFMR